MTTLSYLKVLGHWNIISMFQCFSEAKHTKVYAVPFHLAKYHNLCTKELRKG